LGIVSYRVEKTVGIDGLEKQFVTRTPKSRDRAASQRKTDETTEKALSV
jgi:hypothetical protein